MRILLLIHNLDLGGAQSAVLNLARGLVQQDVRPLVVAWRRGGVLAPRFREAGIELDLPDAERGGWRRLQVPALLRGLIARHGIDLVHAHMSDSAAWAALLQRRGGRPAVVTHHTNELIDTVGLGRPVYGWLRRRLLFASARRVAANIAVSESVRARLAREAGLADETIAVIPNGIALPSDEAVQEACVARAARQAPRIVFVGRLAESKGLETLIGALPRVLEAFPGAELELIGDGPERAALEARVRDLRLGGSVSFSGFVADVAPRLAQADLMVSPSRIEGLPLAVLEAMAWSLPVVASDIPGHRELIRPGETGTLVPPDDPHALALGTIAALRDPQRSRSLAVQARALVRRDYSAEAMARRHIALYRRLLAPAAKKSLIEA